MACYYIETEGHIQREYALHENSIEVIQTDKALLEIVPSKAFDEMIFLDGELQFTKKDEYIYHEMLVHPAMTCVPKASRICILGGGDGCAAREVLKHYAVESVDIYDYDASLVNYFRNCPILNNRSLQSEKVKVHIQDVCSLSTDNQFDVIIVDLTDPNLQEPTCKNVWTQLMKNLSMMLRPEGSLVINAGGILPWNCENVEWLMFLLTENFRNNSTHTIEAYKTFVPSFVTEWCFLLLRPIDSYFRHSIFLENEKFKYFDEVAWSASTKWSKDTISRIPKERVKLNGYLPPL